MEEFLGVLASAGLFFFLNALWWIGRRYWRRAIAPPSPQPPPSPAQQANRQVFEHLEANHPRVMGMKLQRRRPRGRMLRIHEEEEL